MNPTVTDEKFVVVVYDITKNKTRARVLKILKGHGEHIQKSAFECFLNEEQLEALSDRIADLIDEDKDTVRFYVMNEKQRRLTRVLGLGRVYENKPLIVI